MKSCLLPQETGNKINENSLEKFNSETVDLSIKENREVRSILAKITSSAIWIGINSDKTRGEFGIGIFFYSNSPKNNPK